jgi:hypothetical protein
MPLKKPSQLFKEEKVFITEDYSPIVETFNETFDKFRGNLTVVENLTEKVNYLTEEIENKITKGDLENAMFSHLMMVDESIKSIDAKVKGLNKNDLLEFKRTSSHLLELVEELTENQFPKYKKKIVDTEVKISEKFNIFKEEVTQTQEIAENNLQEKLDNFAEVVDNNFSVFNEKIQQTKNYVNETVETYKKLHKILESKTQKENEKLNEYSSVLENFNDEFVKFQENIQEQIKEYEKINLVLDERFKSFGYDLNEWKNTTQSDLDHYKKETSSDVSALKANIIVYENHNKSLKNKLESVEQYIQNHHNDIEELKEEVYGDIEKLPFGNIQENIQRLEKKIDFIRETYSKIEPEVIVKEVIKEGLAEPSSSKNEDPLTPLDQNFVTLDQLQQHYRLFINRIQQQLSTLGGGGETQLKYLDDIVGIATNASAYDGKYLKYNHSLGKFEFTDVDISNDSWADGINGPYTNGSVGIGTSIANCELDVVGNVCVTGVVTATDFNSLSDLKLKENVGIIEKPVDTIMKIEGVNFNWKESGKLSMGVIAQQLEETLPQLVSGDEIKTVNYNGLIGLLIEVVKDQQKQIDELRDLLDK